MKLKTGLVVGGIVFTLATGVSYAAEDSRFAGFYLGGFAGVSQTNVGDYEENYLGGSVWNSQVPKMEGVTAGIYGGYNYQVNNYVLGLEADFGFNSSDAIADNGWSNFDIKWTSHIRAKAGLIVQESTLFYLATGIAITQIENDDRWDSGGGTFWFGKDDATFVGWTIGAGIDHMVNDNLLLRCEYLYDNFGSEDYSISFDGEPNYIASHDLDSHTLRVGISYLF